MLSNSLSSAQVNGMHASKVFRSYFRCPQEFLPALQNGASGSTGHFTSVDHIPFDPDMACNNLRLERYVAGLTTEAFSRLSTIYYFFRPLLPVLIRRPLQRYHLEHRNQAAFPHWPLDCSVDNIQSKLMLLALRSHAANRIPFIWFWPDSKSSCAIMTHDVESAKGKALCSALMDIDDAYGIKASFQIIPEGRYTVETDFLDSIRCRGFQIAVHDLHHNGRLYVNRDQFLLNAQKINGYMNEFQTEGFRAGALYRNQSWYGALNCSYDMSVPNTAHFDPQPGGCCTVMPYFIERVLEIPVTTVQDYTLFHILHDYSIDVWKRQTEQIMKMYGLMSFIVHPDYIFRGRAARTYRLLLDHLNHLEKTQGVWITTPAEVNRWWRQRAAMTVERVCETWQIRGEGCERACLAYASEIDGQLYFTLAGPCEASSDADVNAPDSKASYHLATK